MNLVDLIITASMPMLKVLLLSFTGLILALDRVDILSKDARKHLNKVVFYVFNPALVLSNLAKTVTFESLLTLWFMPINMLIAFIIGTALGWLLFKIAKPPKHLKGVVIAACCAGNMGKLPIIILPAMCNEKGSPFGPAESCKAYGLAYASLSLALGAILMWSYVFNIVRVYSKEVAEEMGVNSSHVNDDETLESSNTTTCQLPSVHHPLIDSSLGHKIALSTRIREWFTKFAETINLKAIMAPSIIGAIIGFMIGMITPLRKLLIGNDAPLHIVQDSIYMLGEATIPCLILILGANLLQGLKRSEVQFKIVAGIAIVRYVLLPPIGILVIRGAIRYGILKCDPMFQFALLVQYAVPPAMNLSTMTQLFGVGNSEYSVIMLWTYSLAAISLTFWSTVFLWLVAT